jgi:hypothetical protein
MGRYISGDFEYKFWFACQPSDDIEGFGGSGWQEPHWTWERSEDLPKVTKELKYLEEEFKKKWGITFDEFQGKVSQKGYLTSTGDEETQTDRWNAMARDASKIDLGRAIKKALEENEYVEVTYEE